MRIKCNPEDYHLDDGSCEASGEVAASCVDYQTLGISRMRNQNISTEIIGDLEPSAAPFISTLEPKMSSYEPKDNLPKQSFVDDNQLDMKVCKSESLEFRRNYSQSEIRKNSTSTPGEYSRDFAAEGQGMIRFYSTADSSGNDQVDGNFIGGNVILGEYDTKKAKESLLPTFKDFSCNNGSDNNDNNNSSKNDTINMNQLEDNDINDTISSENVPKGKPYALATLDGTIMLVQDEIILW